MSRKGFIVALVTLVACLGLVLGCSNSSDSSSDSHSYSDTDTQNAIDAYTAGTTAAESNIGGSGDAYATLTGGVSGTTYNYTIYLANYTDSSTGITVNGTLAWTIDTSTYNFSIVGNLTFSGTTVSTIAFNMSYTSSAYSGTYTITYTDGSSWTYDLATGAFTES
jgi:hypothetical protein